MLVKPGRRNSYAKFKFVEKIEAKAERFLIDATAKQAKDALYKWRDMFSGAGRRKSPKRAKPRDNPFYVWELRPGGAVRELGTARRFKQLLKRDERAGRGFQGIEVGALSRIRERNFRAKDEAFRKRQLVENMAKAATRRHISQGARRAAKPAKPKAWVDLAIKDGFDGYYKPESSKPGDVPMTWKNPDRGVNGKQKRSFPDYYLRSLVRLEQIDATRWELVIKPFFPNGDGLKIFRTLEYGGVVPKRTKRQVGYFVQYYRLKNGTENPAKRWDDKGVWKVRPGVEYGRERRRIVPRYVFDQSPIRIEPRPFLKPLQEQVEQDKLKFLKF